jgi:hypothetical protein
MKPIGGSARWGSSARLGRSTSAPSSRTGYAVELAGSAGLRVVASASADDEGLLLDLGAELFVERTASLGAAVRAVVPGGVDGALDAGVAGVAALDAVRDRGAFVSLVAGAAPLPLRGTRVHNQWIADEGRLTLRVADTLPLNAVAEAHRRQATGGLRGRIVLTS